MQVFFQDSVTDKVHAGHWVCWFAISYNSLPQIYTTELMEDESAVFVFGILFVWLCFTRIIGYDHITL